MSPSLVGSPVEPILAKLDGVRGRAPKWTARCPAHDDQHSSLSIRYDDGGKPLLKCHAGCAYASILAAIGLSAADLAPVGDRADAAGPAVARAQGVETRARLVATYDYHDADGQLVYQVCRFSPKTFRQRRRDAGGEWRWGLGDVVPVLYRWPEVLDALAHERPIYVVEGEKDVDALVALGLDATTSPMGAGKWREAYAEPFEAAEVVLVPDNDDVGRSHMEQVAASLTTAGARVRVVALEGVPPKGDVSDWLAAGGTRAQLEARAEATPPWCLGAVSAAKRVRWRLDELLNDQTIMRPPPIIVPRLAWQGRSTLLAAREKSGKSTIVGYIAAQVSRGGGFLDGDCEFGDVLLIGLEEFVGDTARRLRDFGANPAAVHLVIGFLGEPRTRTQELADHIDAIQPSLVIVDSLAAYGHGQVDDDNSAAQMGAIVQPLTDLAHARAVAVVIAAHSRKSDGRARGSTAITAGVDVVAEMVIPDDADGDPTVRRMHTVGRMPVPRQYDMRFDGRTYTLADGWVPPLETRVLNVIRERPGCSRSDVVQAVGGRAAMTHNVLSELIATRTIRDQGTSSSRARLYLAADAELPLMGDAGFPSQRGNMSGHPYDGDALDTNQ